MVSAQALTVEIPEDRRCAPVSGNAEERSSQETSKIAANAGETTW